MVGKSTDAHYTDSDGQTYDNIGKSYTDGLGEWYEENGHAVYRYFHDPYGWPEPTKATLQAYKPSFMEKAMKSPYLPLQIKTIFEAVNSFYIGTQALLGFKNETRDLFGHSGMSFDERYMHAMGVLSLPLGGVGSMGSVAPGTTVAEEGGSNLFKFGSEEATSSMGWKSGDRFLKMFDQGSPKLNWEQNSGFLRREMNAGSPIFDSYRLPDGNLIPTKGFLNAERNLLQSKGWIYNSSQGAWLPPVF